MMLSKDIHNYFKKYVKNLLSSFEPYDKIMYTTRYCNISRMVCIIHGFGTRLVNVNNKFKINEKFLPTMYEPFVLIKNITYVIDDKYKNLKLDDRPNWWQVRWGEQQVLTREYDFDHFYVLISDEYYLVHMDNLESDLSTIDCKIWPDDGKSHDCATNFEYVKSIVIHGIPHLIFNFDPGT